MPTKIQKKTPNPLYLRNKTEHGDIVVLPVSISMPLSLKLKLDNIAGTQQRSAYVCKILKQHFSKIHENDPRWLLKQKEEEYEEWKLQRQIEYNQLHSSLNTLDSSTDYEDKEYKKELRILQEKAKEKKKELLK